MKRASAALALATLGLATPATATPPRAAACVGEDCKECEGLGGVIPYGKTADDIVVPKCEVLENPKKTGEKVPEPLFPKEYTVNVTGSYSSRWLARPFDHNYYHLDCVYEYSASKNALHFVNTQHINDKHDPTNPDKIKDNVVEGLHVGATLVTLDRFHIPFKKEPLEACYCLNYTIKGEPVGPVSYDAFLRDAQYIGREKLTIEYGLGEKVVDHYQKSFYHYWFDVEAGVPVRTLNRQDDDFIMSVYYNWTKSAADEAFELPEACGAWWQKPWNKCQALNHTANAEAAVKSDFAGFMQKKSVVWTKKNRLQTFVSMKNKVLKDAKRAVIKDAAAQLYGKAVVKEDDEKIVLAESKVNGCDFFRKVQDGECADACLSDPQGICPRGLIVKGGGLDSGDCKSLGYTVADGSVKQQAGPCGTLTFNKYKQGSVIGSDVEEMMYV